MEISGGRHYIAFIDLNVALLTVLANLPLLYFLDLYINFYCAYSLADLIVCIIG